MTDPTTDVGDSNPEHPGTPARPAFSMESYMKPNRFPGWVAPAALLLGAVGTVLSLWALKSASDNASGITHTGDGKARVCSAFATVSKAVSLQTNGGAEPLPEPLTAANARQALLGGGGYLIGQIDGKTPKDLADAISTFANDIQVLGLNYLGGAVNTDPAQAELIKKADSGLKAIGDMCK